MFGLRLKSLLAPVAALGLLALSGCVVYPAGYGGYGYVAPPVYVGGYWGHGHWR